MAFDIRNLYDTDSNGYETLFNAAQTTRVTRVIRKKVKHCFHVFIRTTLSTKFTRLTTIAEGIRVTGFTRVTTSDSIGD